MASTTPAEGAPAVAMGGDGGGAAGGGGGVAQLRLPSADEIRAQDIFNNCAVRTVVSGVMGTCAPNFFVAGWLAVVVVLLRLVQRRFKHLGSPYPPPPPSSFFFWAGGGVGTGVSLEFGVWCDWGIE